jgi:diguanylate cyclase (GGDEF)-like protein/PAS domain S-box-containing protein
MSANLFGSEAVAPGLRTRRFALAALAVGLLGVTGYLTHTEVLLELIPGFGMPIVLCSAVCLALAATAILLGVESRPGWPRWVGPALVVLVMALALSVLIEYAFGLNLGVDLASWHEWSDAALLQSGRMGLDAALTLLAFGAAYFLARGAPLEGEARLTRALVRLVVLLPVLGAAADLLSIDFLETWPVVSRLSLPTTLGLLALAMSLREQCRHQRWYRTQRKRAFGDQLALDAELLLLIVAATASLVAFAVLQRSLERLMSEQLREQLEIRASYFDSTLLQFAERTAMIASRPGVIRFYERLAEQPSDQVARDGLEDVARSFLPHGFRAVQFLDQAGNPVATMGNLRDYSELGVVLHARQPQKLIWDDGFLLRASEPIVSKGVLLGTVVTEQPMINLTRLSTSGAEWGKTGEVGLCAASGDHVACFPTRFQSHPFIMPRSLAGQPFPVSRALDGEIGTTKVMDRRHERVLAAYRPVGATGLGMVMKLDLVEIYGPIRDGFLVILPLVILLVAAGAWLLRWRMRPVLAQMSAVQRAVLDSENRFRIASESGIDAFMILASRRAERGPIVDFEFDYLNRNAERMLGRARGELLHQLVTTTLPVLLKDGWLERYRRAVESGRGTDAEHLLEIPDLPAIWVHQHVVPLGDGVAVTLIDITERKRLEEDLRQMAQADPLTQLPNHALFLDRLERAMIRTRGVDEVLAVLAVDIDRFQALNQDYGHSSGDAVLKAFAMRLAGVIDVEDTVARIGADQFGIILERLASGSEAFATAQAALAVLRQEVPLNDTTVRTSASIGIALYAGETTTATALLARASSAVAEAKRQGGDSYCAAQAREESS